MRILRALVRKILGRPEPGSIQETGETGELPTTNYSEFHHWPNTIPLPNSRLMGAVSVGRLDVFLAIGEGWAQLVSHYLPPEPRLLDIGCGCGKLARGLYLNPTIHYVGFDISKPSIVWCTQAFSELAGKRFTFHHFDGYSDHYNPGGKINAIEYRFPVEDGEVNVAVAGSLFTHLLEDECAHYLEETARVLTPGGKAIISIHDTPEQDKKYS